MLPERALHLPAPPAESPGKTNKYFYEPKIFSTYIFYQSLGLVHLELGSPRLAETTLRAAIRLDPNNHTSWYNLGLVMEVM